MLADKGTPETSVSMFLEQKPQSDPVGHMEHTEENDGAL